MAQENHVIDIGPITTALRLLICDDSPFDPASATGVELAMNLRDVCEFIQAHPELRDQVLGHIGLQAMGFLAQRAAAQSLFVRAIQKASGK